MNAGDDERPSSNDQDVQVARPSTEIQRPPLTGRMHYLVGGTLPLAFHPWVSQDLTGPGWRIRQALRPFALMLPFALIFAMLPGAISTRMLVVAFLLVSSVGLGFATSGYFRNHRLEQHGFPPVLPAHDEDDPE